MLFFPTMQQARCEQQLNAYEVHMLCCVLSTGVCALDISIPLFFPFLPVVPLVSGCCASLGLAAGCGSPFESAGPTPSVSSVSTVSAFLAAAAFFFAFFLADLEGPTAT